MDFCSSSMKPSAPLLNTTTFTGKPSCARLRKSPISMVKPPSPDSEITCRPGNAAWAPIACAIALAIEPCQNEPDQPPLAVHRQIARGPHRRQADVAGEDGVLGGLVADRLGDLLRMDEPLAGRADGEIVERLARLGVVLLRLGEMRAVALLLEQRQQRRERRAHVADHAEIDRRAAADVLRPDIDLRDADAAPSRIELPIGEIGPEHQQDVAVEHRVIAGREADQPGHADVVGVVPLDMLLAAQRVHHRRLEALAERQQLVVRALASRAAQDRDAAARR